MVFQKIDQKRGGIMGSTLNEILENYLVASNVDLQKGTDSISFTINSTEGISKTSIYNILPYIHLIFFDIHTWSLPGETLKNAEVPPLQFSYCVGGRIELLLDDDSYIYLRENDFCISRQSSQSETYFPTKYYHGITIYFDPDFLNEKNQYIEELFNLKLSELPKVYLSKKDTYLAKSDNKMLKLVEHLWSLYESPSIFHMKLCVLELLYLLLSENNILPEKTPTFYTSVQVEIAKKAELMLTADLKQHIPIKQVAKQFGISETSLKNYFRGVYGKNISDYLRDLRMSIAQKLLVETNMSISEIALQIGYTKQGRFAEIFRKNFQMTPLDYRRMERLKAQK